MPSQSRSVFIQTFDCFFLKFPRTPRQNEPQNSNPTYPTCTMTPDIEGRIGSSLRSLLNSNGLSSVKVIGYEVVFFFCQGLPPPLTNVSTTGTMQGPIRCNW